MTPTTPRIAALDYLRGIAVLGILLANLPGYALPEAAYLNPRAWGGAALADRTVWALNFVFVEGRMRWLFSMLFGASLLLVIERARAAGDSAAQVHFRRLAALFVIGCAHLYLVWWGDILASYAFAGAAAFLFADLRARWLVAVAVALLGWEMLEAVSAALLHAASAAQDSVRDRAVWDAFARGFGVPPRGALDAEIAALRDPLAAIAWRWDKERFPLSPTAFDVETLAAMLLGMAAYRTGFVTGAWSRARYRRVAALALGLTLPCYALMAVLVLRHDFDQRWVHIATAVAAMPLRAPGALGYAALALLLFDPRGSRSARIGAAGRTALTNYLGTSLVMALLFTGFGQFGAWSRTSLYLLVLPLWAAMLTWPRPWLARRRHGPIESLWRKIAAS